MLPPVYAYRDSRTEAAIPQVHEKMPFTQLYARTGCQFQPFTTIYQLYDDKVNGRLDGVTDMLMIPEYLMWKLCGVKAREYTEATTTGIINAQTSEFDMEIVETLGYPKVLFPATSQPGTVIGEYEGIKVVLCATHDTGSAVEGIPMEGTTIPIFPPALGLCWASRLPSPLRMPAAKKPTTPTRAVLAITAIKRILWVCGW